MAESPKTSNKPVVSPFEHARINSLLGNVSLNNQYQVNFGIFTSPSLSNHLSRYFDIKPDFYTRDLGLMCASASLPTSSFATGEVKDNYMGVVQQFAHTRFYTDADFTFYVDNNYKVMRFFEGWMDFISGSGAAQSPKLNYYRRMAYPIQYKVNSMNIVKFERTHKHQTYNKKKNPKFSTLNYQFINAFPKGIVSIPVTYGSAELLKVTVTFAYDRYILNRLPDQAVPAEEAPTVEGTDVPQPQLSRSGLNSQQTLDELYEAGRSGKIRSASEFIGPLQ
jgi:hypothetical protein